MNRKRNTKRKNGRRNKPRNRVTEVVLSRRDPSYPPQNNVKPFCTRTLRYIANSAANGVPVTRRCLLNTVLTGVSGTTTAVNIYEAVRLERVSMYFVTSSGFGTLAEELIISWTGDRSPDSRFSDRGTLSHPACIKTRPPRGSLASFWSNVTADMDEPLFYVTMPQYAIIDLTLTFCIGDAGTKTCVVVDPGLSGVIYSALDNAIVAGTVGGEVLRPDSLTYANMTTP